MPLRPRKLKTKAKAVNDDSDTNNNDILLSPDNNNISGNNTPHETQEHIFLNVATTSKTSTSGKDPSTDIPLSVKQYIDAAFERQTLELKALFQHLNSNNSNLFPSNTQHEPDTNTDANTHHETNHHIDRNLYGSTARHTNLNKDSIRKTNQQAPKRPSSNLNDNDDVNSDNNKRPCTIQGEQQHTNSTSLANLQDLLQNRTNNSKSNNRLLPPTLDVTLSRVFSHSSFLAPQQDDSTLLH